MKTQPMERFLGLTFECVHYHLFHSDLKIIQQIILFLYALPYLNFKTLPVRYFLWVFAYEQFLEAIKTLIAKFLDEPRSGNYKLT